MGQLSATFMTRFTDVEGEEETTAVTSGVSLFWTASNHKSQNKTLYPIRG
jgi:hypothetical protein